MLSLVYVKFLYFFSVLHYLYNAYEVYTMHMQIYAYLPVYTIYSTFSIHFLCKFYVD
jgi:hypothetical protein